MTAALGHLCERWRDAFATEACSYGLDGWIRHVTMWVAPANRKRYLPTPESPLAEYRSGGPLGPTAMPVAALRKQLDVTVTGSVTHRSTEYAFHRDDTFYGYLTQDWMPGSKGPRKQRSKIHWQPNFDQSDGWPPQAPLIFAAVELALHESAERVALADVTRPASETETEIDLFFDRLDNHPLWPHDKSINTATLTPAASVELTFLPSTTAEISF